MKRRRTPLQMKWDRRVSGQIKHAMHEHPEYFRLRRFSPGRIANSLTKRIVGEIVADLRLAADARGVDDFCDCARVSGVRGKCPDEAAGCQHRAPLLSHTLRAIALFGLTP